MLLAWFITERAIPFIGFWEDAIDEVETGGSLTIAPTLPADRGKNTREFGSPIHRSPD